MPTRLPPFQQLANSIPRRRRRQRITESSEAEAGIAVTNGWGEQGDHPLFRPFPEKGRSGCHERKVVGRRRCVRRESVVRLKHRAAMCPRLLNVFRRSRLRSHRPRNPVRLKCPVFNRCPTGPVTRQHSRHFPPPSDRRPYHLLTKSRLWLGHNPPFNSQAVLCSWVSIRSSSYPITWQRS